MMNGLQTSSISSARLHISDNNINHLYYRINGTIKYITWIIMRGDPEELKKIAELSDDVTALIIGEGVIIYSESFGAERLDNFVQYRDTMVKIIGLISKVFSK